MAPPKWAAGLLLGGLLAASAPAANAATFTVDSTGDAPDAASADARCDADSVLAGDQCTLRAALQQANALSGADGIEFELPVSTTIAPGSTLPTVTDSVTIDGTTQSVGRVTLDGTAAGASTRGLTISAGSSTVRGLTIVRFGQSGIRLLTNGGNTIAGNYLGTTGDAAAANSIGVSVESGAGNTIGGSTAADRNVISGNSGAGVTIGQAATANTVRGNRIGTNADGTAALPNSTGISIGAPNNTIGGTASGAGNLISGNTSDGISLIATGTQPNGTLIQGNRIGTNAAGNAALANGAQGVGIAAGTGVVVGGASDGAGNLISGNGDHGVYQNAGTASIKGNRIGVKADGSALGNVGAGVRAAAPGLVIGGTGAGEGNRIVNNRRDGVNITSTGVSVLGNSITANGNLAGSLGIDLGSDGATPNDDVPDADVGANNLQNFPLLSQVESSSGGTVIAGTLSSAPGTTYRVEFFDSAACDHSGNGEGDHMLGATTVTTPGSGTTGVSFSTATVAAVGRVVTATATDPNGNTSEFSPCRTVTAAPPLVGASIGDATVTEGNSGTTNATFTVSLDAPSTGTVSVEWATADGTATSPADYQAQQGTVTFTAGQTSKTVTVGVKGDTVDEDDETFSVGLSNPTRATLSDASGTGTIQDDDAAPTVSVADVTLQEPSSGTSAAVFDVTLSHASGHTVTVNYATANGIAKGGSDYTGKSGTVTFAPGDTQETVSVNVLADAQPEGDETFRLNLSAPVRATIADGAAVATITDTANPPELTLADVSVQEPDPGDNRRGLTQVVPRLDQPYTQDVTVTMTSQAGTATSGQDYSAPPTETVTIEAGDTAPRAPASGQDEAGFTFNALGDTVSPEPNETATVTITDATYATITDGSATVTITDTPPPTLSVADVTVAEPDPGEPRRGLTQVVPRLSRPYGSDVTVTMASQAGTATAGQDYNAPATETLTIKAGDTAPDSPAGGQDEQGYTFGALGDTISPEPDETATVTITGATLATVADGNATVTITDTPPPSLSVVDVTVAEPDPGEPRRGLTQVVPRLSRPYGSDVTVTMASQAGTATAGQDYNAPATETLTIKAGDTAPDSPAGGQDEQGYTFIALADTVSPEPDEAATVTITGATFATVADGSAAVTITDTPPPPAPPSNPGTPLPGPGTSPPDTDTDASPPLQFGPSTQVTLGGKSSVPVTPRGNGTIVVENKNPFPVKGKLQLTAPSAGLKASAARQVKVATSSFTVPAGKKQRVRVKLSRSALRTLRRKRRLTVTSKATLTDPAGRSRSVKRKMKLVLR